MSLVDWEIAATLDKEVAKTLNQYFSNTVNFLEITENKYLLTETKNLEDPIEKAINKFENHHRVLSIKGNYHYQWIFPVFRNNIRRYFKWDQQPWQ